MFIKNKKLTVRNVAGQHSVYIINTNIIVNNVEEKEFVSTRNSRVVAKCANYK